MGCIPVVPGLTGYVVVAATTNINTWLSGAFSRPLEPLVRLLVHFARLPYESAVHIDNHPSSQLAVE
jgi:hypothetical protein